MMPDLRAYILEQLANAEGEKQTLSARACKFGDVPRARFAELRDRIKYLENELLELDNRRE